MTGGLIFRLFIGGSLVDERHVMKGEEAAQLSLEHCARVSDAGDTPWMVEIEDPDGPPSVRYHRFGTDDRLMVAPEVTGDDHLERSPLIRRLEQEAAQ